MVSETDIGLSGNVVAPRAVLMTMAAFMAISLYNVIELNIIIFSTFKRRSGLYFWSFLFATWGIAPHTIGFICKFFSVISEGWINVTLVGIGWVAMVTGQSVVLYSRLHLVVQSPEKIRWILYMIILNFVIFGVPTMILAYGANSSNPAPFLRIFAIYDNIQIAVFTAQESIISILYIYQTVRLLAPTDETMGKPLRKLLTHLIIINILVLLFDIALLGVQYSGHYEIQTTLKAAVYSIKLKMEFSVLNRLVCIIQNKDLAMGSQNIFHSPSNRCSIQLSPTSPAGYPEFPETDSACLPATTLSRRETKTTELYIKSNEIDHHGGRGSNGSSCTAVG